MGEKFQSLWRTKALRPDRLPRRTAGAAVPTWFLPVKYLATGELTAALGSGRGIRW
jgi:hypothetical protein